MPLLGAHMSIAGGLHLAVDRLIQVGGQALQIFAKNQRQWKGPELDDETIGRFRHACAEAGHPVVAVHDTYLVNLASPDDTVLNRSIQTFADELDRTERLGIPYLVAHPGSYVLGTLQDGLSRFIQHLDQAIQFSHAPSVRVLIENTAGQGTQLGSRFEEIAFVLHSSKYANRLGVCFDTCHAFAAGYDLRTRTSFRSVFAEFDRIIGLPNLYFFHLNDSKRELGSRVDRHEHIGRGKIGLNGFKWLLNDPGFRHHPMVLETPKEKNLLMDRENLRILKSLVSVNR
jgi:deoxyribonuclease IV